MQRWYRLQEPLSCHQLYQTSFHLHACMLITAAASVPDTPWMNVILDRRQNLKASATILQPVPSKSSSPCDVPIPLQATILSNTTMRIIHHIMYLYLSFRQSRPRSSM